MYLLLKGKLLDSLPPSSRKGAEARNMMSASGKLQVEHHVVTPHTSNLTPHTSYLTPQPPNSLQVMKRDAEARGFFLRAQRVNPAHPWVVKNAGVFA